MVFENYEIPTTAGSYADASQAFRQELALADSRPSPFAPTPAADQTQSPQDKRAADLIKSLSDPNLDMGRIIDKLRHTFVEEFNAGGGARGTGVQGITDLADKVSKGTGLSLSVGPYRSSNRVYAISITDRAGKTREIPITGR